MDALFVLACQTKKDAQPKSLKILILQGLSGFFHIILALVLKEYLRCLKNRLRPKKMQVLNPLSIGSITFPYAIRTHSSHCQ